MRSIFQWSDDEEEASGYASTSTTSSIQASAVPVYMTEENKNLARRLDGQEQAIEAQQ